MDKRETAAIEWRPIWSTIEITKVANGWLVRPKVSPGHTVAHSDTYAFTKMADLGVWLNQQKWIGDNAH
mgnify:CR=1 FL=1